VENSESTVPDTVAAVDLGSNSFHMIVARSTDGDLQVIDRLKEMVRLGEGLTGNRGLRPEVAERALACLARFGQRLRGMQPGSVRTVGTNTLRQVRLEDVRERTVTSLCQRFDVEAGHADGIKATALTLYGQVAQPWRLTDPDYPSMLGWAARLHEIGLAIGHSQYQKHGAYLLKNADLSGFTRQEQSVLAALVLGHRRKFPVQELLALPKPVQDCSRRLCIILRLAVLMHRSRSPTARPYPMLNPDGDRLRLSFPDGWLAQHPQTRLELEWEAERLAAGGVTLSFR
jgi:exopolyphosphatase/pppGpp-phosphohydrolase